MPGTRPAPRRRSAGRTALVVAPLTGLALLAGCSQGPDPDGQREEMVAATQSAIESVLGMVDATEAADVIDDGTQAVPCGEGELYQYLAYMTTDLYVGEPVAQSLGDVVTVAHGASLQVPGGGDYFSDSHETGSGEAGRQVRFSTGSGITLTVEAALRPDGEAVLRIGGTTACG